MRMLWHAAAPWNPTGYGQQTAMFVPMLHDAGHEIAISSVAGVTGSCLNWYKGITVYPGDNAYGNKWLRAYVEHHARMGGEPVQLSDVLTITLFDVWVIEAESVKGLWLASWVPVDHEPVPPAVLHYFRSTGAVPIAMSKFGVEQLEPWGLKPLYVPHGVDTELMRPMDRADVRRKMKLPEGAFVYGMVANNMGTAPSRKAFPEVLEAFSKVCEKHDDVYLYLHARASAAPEGLDLPKLAVMFGIPEDRLMFTPEFELHLGVEAERMPYVFNVMDVLVNPAYGEGFGIPIMEAQACGVPVIVNNFSAMTELCGSGWMTGGHRWYDATQGSFMQAPDVPQLIDCMEQAYAHARDDDVRGRAREFALQYDKRRVFDEYWVPALAEIERRHQPQKPKQGRVVRKRVKV